MKIIMGLALLIAIIAELYLHFSMYKLSEKVENFEEWVAVVGGELEENYDFDASAVSEGDYFYIDTKYDPAGLYHGKFDHYTIYIFDVEQMTLYYFHSNI